MPNNPFLIIEYRGKQNQYPLDKDGVIIIGRDAKCDLTLVSRTISHCHCQCTVKGEEVTIKDLGSKNGVLVNGKCVDEVKLNRDDSIVLSKSVRLLFKCGSETSSSVPVIPSTPQGFKDFFIQHSFNRFQI